MTQQEELLRSIYSESDLANVQYIEAHGTGTPVGDPIEAGSISNVIAKARPPGSAVLQIGSVKGNIGHTESAAGVAGLIKVLLMMKHATIVPSVFYSEESASVDFKSLNIKVPKEAEKWEVSGPRIAGVNNFGFGGTNSHVIVKQHKQSHTVQRNDEKQTKFFVISANSPKSLTLMMEDTIKQVQEGSKVDLASLVYTSACKRSHLKHRYRKAIIVSSVDDLREKLGATVNKKINPSNPDSKLVFVYCGNGVTYYGMCRQLLKHEPVFRDKIREIAQLFLRLSTMNIMDACILPNTAPSTTTELQLKSDLTLPDFPTTTWSIASSSPVYNPSTFKVPFSWIDPSNTEFSPMIFSVFLIFCDIYCSCALFLDFYFLSKDM